MMGGWENGPWFARLVVMCAPQAARPVFLPRSAGPRVLAVAVRIRARVSDDYVQPRTVTRPTRHRRFPSIPGAHRVSRGSVRSSMREVREAGIEFR